MTPVVAGLAALPESDVRAVAHYLAPLSPPVDAAARQARGAETVATLGLENGRRVFNAACAVCHAESVGVGHFGVRPLMGLNTSVSLSTPDNLMRVLHHGIDQPATDHLGYMPGFDGAFDGRKMAELVAYIRARYAPGGGRVEGPGGGVGADSPRASIKRAQRSRFASWRRSSSVRRC
ncbi:hypothetical protein WS86_30595 [Burkholderia savannae]|nr:hypothetical protein WS86_30595 [Burkholderia savannae]